MKLILPEHLENCIKSSITGVNGMDNGSANLSNRQSGKLQRNLKASGRVEAQHLESTSIGAMGRYRVCRRK